jgi:hypothetical protein
MRRRGRPTTERCNFLQRHASGQFRTFCSPERCGETRGRRPYRSQHSRSKLLASQKSTFALIKGRSASKATDLFGPSQQVGHTPVRPNGPNDDDIGESLLNGSAMRDLASPRRPIRTAMSFAFRRTSKARSGTPPSQPDRRSHPAVARPDAIRARRRLQIRTRILARSWLGVEDLTRNLSIR